MAHFALTSCGIQMRLYEDRQACPISCSLPPIIPQSYQQNVSCIPYVFDHLTISKIFATPFIHCIRLILRCVVCIEGDIVGFDNSVYLKYIYINNVSKRNKTDNTTTTMFALQFLSKSVVRSTAAVKSPVVYFSTLNGTVKVCFKNSISLPYLQL